MTVTKGTAQTQIKLPSLVVAVFAEIIVPHLCDSELPDGMPVWQPLFPAQFGHCKLSETSPTILPA